MKSHQYHPANKFFGGYHRGVLEYENGKGAPVPKLMTMESHSRGEKKGFAYNILGKENHKFSKVEYNRGVGEEEFRLSYYGLPEPAGVTWPKPIPWHFLFGGLAGVALGLNQAKASA